MRRFPLIIACLLLVIIGCNKATTDKSKLTKLRPDVSLPPKSETGVDLYIYSDCEKTMSDIRFQMFGGDTGNVRLYKAVYEEKDANGLLSSGKFKTYSTTYRGKASTVYFKGGRITDQATYKGNAKTIIHVIPGIGWFRVK